MSAVYRGVVSALEKREDVVFKFFGVLSRVGERGVRNVEGKGGQGVGEGCHVRGAKDSLL